MFIEGDGSCEFMLGHISHWTMDFKVGVGVGSEVKGLVGLRAARNRAAQHGLDERKHCAGA